MLIIAKQRAILSIGLAALVIGLVLESFLRVSGKIGHFSGGFFLGMALVLLIAAGSCRIRISVRS